MDTRRYRSPPPSSPAKANANANATEGDDTLPEPEARTMLGPTQLAALHAWLHRVNTTHPAPFKFIISSVPFTSLWTHDAQIDAWAGYAEEKAALLAAFHSVPNVVVISGDRHEFGAVEFSTEEGARGYAVREFSTSPLSMFYIPIIHTMRERSEAFFTRNVGVSVNNVNATNSDNETAVAITEEQVPYEKRIAYIPTGNVKWYVCTSISSFHL